MLDLAKIKLPDGIEAEGKFFNLNTDFRAWLCFGRLINNPDTREKDLEFLFSDKIPQNINAVIPELLAFYNPVSTLPRPMSSDTSERVIDYDLDADLIYSAFYERYNIDLLQTDKTGHIIQLHWHKFLALLNGLHDTRLNEIMGYRMWKRPNGKLSDYDRQMQKLHEAWKLPPLETPGSKKQLEEWNSLFL